MTLTYHENYYIGFISATGRRYFIKAYIEKNSNWKADDIIIDWRLHSTLGDSLYKFIDENCHTKFQEFFLKLGEYIRASLVTELKPDLWSQNPQKAYNMYKCLEEELIDVEEFIRDVNIEDGIIMIESIDPALRVHKAVLKLTENYPKEAIKIVSHDLPLSFGNFLQKNLNLYSVNTISGFCERFVDCINSFQEFWNNVAILDLHCWILDPEFPTFKDITRRIKISDRISVILTFNPYMCRTRPDIKFLGCHSDVAKFRDILQKNLENDVWNQDADLLTNLVNTLEVKFPSKPSECDMVDNLNIVRSGECAICFMVRSEDETPTLLCDNNSCMSYYHAGCLFKYFSSIPGNKSFFGRIQGKCPNCDQVMSCPVPKSI